MAAALKVFWPEIIDVRSAASAARYAANGAFLVSAVTGAIAIYAIFRGPVFGFDGFALGDAIFTLLVGWRLTKFSRVWAVLGLGYWLLNMLSKVMSPQPGLSPVGVVSIIILLAFITGVRGTFGYHKLTKSRAVAQV